MKAVLSLVLGAKAQVVVGAAASIVGVLAWVYGCFVIPHALTIPPSPVAFVFHVSMFFGLVACYAIVATGLGYRATERVETAVVENIEQVAGDVEIQT